MPSPTRRPASTGSSSSTCSSSSTTCRRRRSSSRLGRAGRRPLLHGLVYDLKDGLLHEIATGIDSQDAADHLADRRLSGVAAGPPPMGRVAGPILAGEGLADDIADRVLARLREADAKRRSVR